MPTTKHPPAQLYHGEDAFDEFNKYLNRLIQETATGQTFVLAREDGFTLTAKPIDAADLVMGPPESCEFIVLDGGSVNGDAWKVSYHPTLRTCTVIKES